MGKLYVTVTNLEFDMSPEDAEAKLIEIMNAFVGHIGDKTQTIATDLPHNVVLEGINKHETPIIKKETRDQ